tara:strand:+ start:632 stop:805 length:174 start_codon:yes stop_codon:yes gene_type:complete
MIGTSRLNVGVILIETKINERAQRVLAPAGVGIIVIPLGSKRIKENTVYRDPKRLRN